MSIAESAEESRTASLIFSPGIYVHICESSDQIQVKGFPSTDLQFGNLRKGRGSVFPCHYPLIFRRYVLFPKTINNFPVNIFTERILFAHSL